MVLHRERVAAVSARPCHGQDARIGIEWVLSHPVVTDDIAGTLLAQNQHEIGATVVVEVAVASAFEAPAFGYEAFGRFCRRRQDRVIDRWDDQLLSQRRG